MEGLLNGSFLVRFIGFPATLIHGDTLILDRWVWLKSRLARLRSDARRLIDIGCGSGPFSLGAARLGYEITGIDGDETCIRKAKERALILNLDSVRFERMAIRELAEAEELEGKFDVVVCCETIEHILDDAKLMRDMAGFLKPGGSLFLTAPNVALKPISRGDDGPYSEVENGAHVRRGYSPDDLDRLCLQAGLEKIGISYCSGLLSQKITALWRTLCRIHPLMAWIVILPLRIMPPILDAVLTPLIKWPFFSICLQAKKPNVPVMIL